jgi:hypothetical protein
MENGMNGMYAMQRANGDWFALDDQGAFRVPVFHSSAEAMQARAFNGAMLLFRPVILDEVAFRDLAPENGGAMHFWLVDHASSNLKRGHRVEHAELSQLDHDVV